MYRCIDKFRTVLIILHFFLSSISYDTFGQSSRGKDFWLMFENGYQRGRQLSINITAQDNTNGYIEIPGVSFYQTFTINAGAVITIAIPDSAETKISDGIETKGIHIASDNDISVYGFNGSTASSDAFLAIPTTQLGLYYMIMSYTSIVRSSSLESEFGIVATENNTVVQIIPSTDSRNHIKGVPYYITLNQYEVYQLKADSFSSKDLTGTQIVSNKLVSVFGGHVCANIPTELPFCNHLIEQLPPIEKWGTDFFITPLEPRMAGANLRVLAAYDDTQVMLNGQLVAKLNQGKFYEINLPTALPLNGYYQISTNVPSLIAQFSKGGGVAAIELGGDGFDASDPFMVLIPPINQYFGSTTFATFRLPHTFSYNYVSIITPQSGVGAITVDGWFYPANYYHRIGSSDYFATQIPLTEGTHAIWAENVLFSSFVYGFGPINDAYGYFAGQKFPQSNDGIIIYNNGRKVLCPGSTVNIGFISTGNITPPNNFQVQLSDSNGSFDNPIIIGNSTSMGDIQCTIPSNISSGTDYKIRVKLASTPIISNVVEKISIIPNNEIILQSPNDDYFTNITKNAQKITASNKVLALAKVIYNASQNIILNPGFNVSSGSTFTAQSFPCN